MKYKYIIKFRLIEFVIRILVLIGCLLSALISVVTVPYIPFEFYCQKMLCFCIIYLFLSYILLVQVQNFITKELYEIGSDKRTVIIISFTVIVLLAGILLFYSYSPQSFSFMYYFLSSRFSETIESGDKTCLSIEEAIKIDNSKSRYFQEAGNVYYRAGDFNKAIFFYNKALDIDNSADNYYFLGKAYLCGYPENEGLFNSDINPEQINFIDSEKYLEKAVEMEPDNAEYNFGLAISNYCLYTEKNHHDYYYEKALTHFNIAVQNDVNSMEKYYYWRGRLQIQKEPELAKTDFEKLELLEPFEAKYQYWLGRSLLESGKYIDSAIHFHKAKFLDYNNSEYEIYADYTNSMINRGGRGDSDNGRPSYTLEEIDKGMLNEQITFNSISDSDYGDEKDFVTVKSTDKEIEIWNGDKIVVEDGQTYTIRMFVHNNSDFGADSIAKGVKASFSLPTTVSKVHSIIGYLDCENAKPVRYWDGITLCSDDTFFVEYVGGSARFTNELGTVMIPDEVITSGSNLGYDKMDGFMPGGYKYSGELTIDIKVHKSVMSRCSMKCRLKGSDEWAEYVYANVGDEVEFQIEYKNLSSEMVKDVMIRDILPNNIVYIDDSTKLYNSNHSEGLRVISNTLTTSGINIGNHAPKGNSYVRFTGVVIDKNLAQGRNQLVNWANTTVENIEGMYLVKDDASVFVSK